ncbi:MAG: metallophosphoesterase family protein [Actinomycetota bacterium]
MGVRIAAVGDIHLGIDSVGAFRPHLEHIADEADLLLFAGDYTMWGAAAEASVFAGEIRDVPVPMIGVLGNHDFHSDEEPLIVEVLQKAGMTVLECQTTAVGLEDATVGIAGAKGFGGGFLGAGAANFGEPEMKAFVRHTKDIAERFEAALGSLESDIKIALLHYSPVEGTLEGERREIFAFLGSYLLAQAIDHVGADLVIHGHAHVGTFRSETPGGIPVYNVAQPLIGSAFHVFELPQPARVH